MTSLWKIAGEKLQRVNTSPLSREEKLEKWIADDPSILGLDIMLIGRQVVTDFGGRIDLLGINREGDACIIELKRDKTPREVIAQVLDYASWVSNLTTKRIHDLAHNYLETLLPKAFRDHFDAPLPENLNNSHSMVIVAGSLDASSQRIVEYLAQDCGININTAFFNFFTDDNQEYLAADWMMNQDEVVWKAENRTKAPWTGVWYANIGQGGDRDWEDMVKYGFLAAGGGSIYSSRLNQLTPGDPVFAYQKKVGYLGYGTVLDRPVIAKDFTVDGQPLASCLLKQPNLLHDSDNPELAEYAVRIDWIKTFPMNDGKTFNGAFANQNVVCRLRDPQTLEFLRDAFNADI